jgi:hypothetical protein
MAPSSSTSSLLLLTLFATSLLLLSLSGAARADHVPFPLVLPLANGAPPDDIHNGCEVAAVLGQRVYTTCHNMTLMYPWWQDYQVGPYKTYPVLWFCGPGGVDHDDPLQPHCEIKAVYNPRPITSQYPRTNNTAAVALKMSGNDTYSFMTLLSHFRASDHDDFVFSLGWAWHCVHDADGSNMLCDDVDVDYQLDGHNGNQTVIDMIPSLPTVVTVIGPPSANDTGGYIIQRECNPIVLQCETSLEDDGNGTRTLRGFCYQWAHGQLAMFPVSDYHDCQRTSYFSGAAGGARFAIGDPHANGDRGMVWMYDCSLGYDCDLLQQLVPDVPVPRTRFGTAVEITDTTVMGVSGQLVLVSAADTTLPGSGRVGAVYTFFCPYIGSPGASTCTQTGLHLGPYVDTGNSATQPSAYGFSRSTLATASFDPTNPNATDTYFYVGAPDLIRGNTLGGVIRYTCTRGSPLCHPDGTVITETALPNYEATGIGRIVRMSNTVQVYGVTATQYRSYVWSAYPPAS